MCSSWCAVHPPWSSTRVCQTSTSWATKQRILLHTKSPATDSAQTNSLIISDLVKHVKLLPDVGLKIDLLLNPFGFVCSELSQGGKNLMFLLQVIFHGLNVKKKSLLYTYKAKIIIKKENTFWIKYNFHFFTNHRKCDYRFLWKQGIIY